MYIHIKLNLFLCNKKGIDSIFTANSKGEAEGYVTTGVTSIPRHLATIMRPFFLDVDQMPAAVQVSIQFHMVSYCSAIKVSLTVILFVPKLTLFTLKVSRSVKCFTSSVSHGTANYFLGCRIRASLMLVSYNCQRLQNFSETKQFSFNFVHRKDLYSV